MGYADTKKIPFVAIVGENEINEGKINLKNMLTGEQSLVTLEELIERFSCNFNFVPLGTPVSTINRLIIELPHSFSCCNGEVFL